MEHFAKVCHSTKQKKTPKRRETVKHTPTTGSTSATNDSSDTDDSDGHDYAFALLPHTESVTVTIEDEPINIVIDSVATCNVINTDVERKLRARGVEPYKFRRKIHPYNSPPIKVTRAITADIAVGGGTAISREFLVIRGNPPPLLCKQTAEALNILSIHIPPNPSVRHITSTPDPTNDILKSFPGIDQGIGRLKNLEVKLHIDKTVPPVACKHSRVPFHSRDKVAKELQCLQEQDIIEKVSGPTKWISRIVTLPKPKSPDEIRLCEMLTRQYSEPEM